MKKYFDKFRAYFIFFAIACCASLSFFLLSVSHSDVDVNSPKIANLVTFAKVYGYVKYFHPSSEATSIDWDYFAIYGAEQIGLCTTNKEVVTTLERLFEPIAPSIVFTDKKAISTLNLKKITPHNLADYQLVFWQHMGIELDTFLNSRDIYASSRVLKNIDLEQNASANNNNSLTNKIFDNELEFGEYIQKEIAEDIHCQIPMVLYEHHENGTFPQSNTNELVTLNKNIRQSKMQGFDVNLRLGNTINTYNVFQHFYPYMDVVDVVWEEELKKALARSFTDITEKDHLITLQKFTAPLNDGHINFEHKSRSITSFGEEYILPISWSWIEGQLVVTGVFNDELNIKIGDIIKAVNHKEPKEYFKEFYSRISAGNMGWLNHRTELFSLLGKKNSKLQITIDATDFDLIRQENLYDGGRFSTGYQPDYQIINDSVVYLNFKTITEETLRESYLAPKLKKAKHIICDVRGRANYFRQLLPSLLPENDTTTSWMNVPKLVYPDQEKLVGYRAYSWSLKKQESYLSGKNFIFLIDGSAISYAESGIGYVQGYNLGIVVGQPTGGTNGNINALSLPGGFRTRWTGMKVLKLDGSQQHGIGFLPDVHVYKTIEGLKNGTDEILEKAISLTQKK
ncbi:S41 family peptidase [Cellulophaga sp. Hel_I_12]|uniref:S41 family peptidase n=1 Tax=Cellulophaga sp. Hel_I_12 TaxID=1249972 RepID=UPI0006457C04|nr:S41 family peptidase [Cellulophaga sp. Hel_I_12]